MFEINFEMKRPSEAALSDDVLINITFIWWWEEYSQQSGVKRDETGGCSASFLKVWPRSFDN